LTIYKVQRKFGGKTYYLWSVGWMTKRTADIEVRRLHHAGKLARKVEVTPGKWVVYYRESRG